MKGRFFKKGNKGYEIVSDPLVMPDGDIEVVVMDLETNNIDVFKVSDIDTICIDRRHIGF